MKSIIRIILCFFLGSSSLIAINAEKVHSSYSNILVDNSVVYSYENGKIREIAYIEVNGEFFNSNRLISEDGSFQMTITSGSEVETIEGIVDYQLFNLIASEYVVLGNSPVPLNSDVIGSQYKHIYIGSGGTQRFDSRVLETISTAAKAYSLLAKYFSWPAAVLSGAAGVLFDFIANQSPSLAIVSSETYEVQFSYDGGYYTHCYHQVIETFDDGGHDTGTSYDYIQVIGG